VPENKFSVWGDLGLSASETLSAVIQDKHSKNVIAVVAMDRESCRLTNETGDIHYLKGITVEPYQYGGNNMSYLSVRLNIDKTALLIETELPFGVQTQSEFGTMEADKSSILNAVYDVIRERKMHPPENSYVAKKLAEGIDRILKKIGEEAGEVIIAAKNADPEEMGWEMADLIFHMWLVLGFYDLTPEIVFDKLIDRRK